MTRNRTLQSAQIDACKILVDMSSPYLPSVHKWSYEPVSHSGGHLGGQTVKADKRAALANGCLVFLAYSERMQANNNKN